MNQFKDNEIHELTESTNINLVGMKLITGRKHQIRCHLSGYLNNAIVNDQRYGGKKFKPLTS